MILFKLKIIIIPTEEISQIIKEAKDWKIKLKLKKNKQELVKAAINLKNELQTTQLGRVVVENTGNIGKSYRKHDEIA